MELTNKKLFKVRPFKEVPFNEVVSFFINGMMNGSINTRASSIAFHFFMAMLPATIFFFSLIRYFPLSGIDDASISILNELLPEQTSYSIIEIVTGFVSKSGGIQIFSIFIAFMFAMNGVNGVIGAFNSTYHTIETRSWLQKRKISVVLVGILFSLFVFATCLLVYSKIFIQFIINHQIINKMFTIYALQAGNWIIIYLLILIAISFTYYLAPADKKNWKFISSGSVLASVLTLIACLIFTFIMNKFGKFNQLFGQAGTLMVVLLWIYFNALALLIGFEFNASINNVVQNK